MSPFRTAELDWISNDLDKNRYPVTARPVPGVRFECPCCGYPTLEERGGYENCELCDWEDDGQDNVDADRVMGGPNYELSLASARENFKRHLEKHAPTSKRFRETTIREADAKRQVMAAFDALRGGAPDKARLWQEICEGEQVLREELHRRVQAIVIAAKARR